MTKTPPSTITIEVTALDISRGKPGNPCKCPIARAAARILKVAMKHLGVTHKRIRVGDWDWTGEDGARPYYLPVPRKVSRFISVFDVERPVKPFSFRTGKPQVADCE